MDVLLRTEHSTVTCYQHLSEPVSCCVTHYVKLFRLRLRTALFYWHEHKYLGGSLIIPVSKTTIGLPSRAYTSSAIGLKPGSLNEDSAIHWPNLKVMTALLLTFWKRSLDLTCHPAPWAILPKFLHLITWILPATKRKFWNLHPGNWASRLPCLPGDSRKGLRMDQSDWKNKTRWNLSSHSHMQFKIYQILKCNPRPC